MSNLLSSLTEASLVLAVLYMGYFFILRHKAAPAFLRAYLLSALLFALIIPFIQIPPILGTEDGVTNILAPASQAWGFLPEMVIYSHQATGGAGVPEAQGIISGLSLFGCLYLAGLACSLLLTGLRLLKIIRLIRQYPFRHSGDSSYQLANTNGRYPTFSFLHYIFWNNTTPLSPAEEKLMLRHEKAHVKFQHSLDILFLELVTALLWFNPVVYLFKRSLQQAHEFQADRYALQQGEEESYLSLMAKQSLRQANIPLISTFFQHNTLTRIHMIKTKPTHTLLRACSCILLVASVFFIGSCEDETNQLESDPQLQQSSAGEESNLAHAITLDLSKVRDYAPQAPYNSEELIRFSAGEYIYTISNIQSQDTYKKIKNGLGQHAPETLHNNPEKLLKILTNASGGPVKQTFSGKEISKTSIVFEDFPDMIALSEGKQQLLSDQVFEVVDDRPEPAGGMEAFYEFIGNELHYPEEALKQEIEGRVFVQFVVDEKGNVSETQTVKGIGAGCDKEAERVIKLSKWSPGRQRGRAVKVRMIMPIMYKI